MSYTLWVITGKIWYWVIKQLHMSICQDKDKPGIGSEPQLCVRSVTAWAMAWLIVRGVNSTITLIIHRVPRLRMNGAIYLLPLYAFMAWIWQHYFSFEKRVVAWRWRLWWMVIVLGYCYVLTSSIFKGYIERKWKIFFCCPHRAAVVQQKTVV